MQNERVSDTTDVSGRSLYKINDNKVKSEPCPRPVQGQCQMGLDIACFETVIGIHAGIERSSEKVNLHLINQTIEVYD